MGDDDARLLEAWRGGDKAAAQAVLERHHKAVYNFFDRKLDAAADINDLIQETFLRCLNKPEAFRGQSTVRTYIFGIAHKVLLEYWRKRARTNETLDFDEISVASLSTSAASRVARRDARARLLAALRELPLEQQLLLELHYWEELEGDQLASIFGIEPATTRSRLFRARDALRKLIDESDARGNALPDNAFDAWARSFRPVSTVRNASHENDTTES
jgi:RNA polymerase sigma factor (sigma-70 family)